MFLLDAIQLSFTHTQGATTTILIFHPPKYKLWNVFLFRQHNWYRVDFGHTRSRAVDTADSFVLRQWLALCSPSETLRHWHKHTVFVTSIIVCWLLLVTDIFLCVDKYSVASRYIGSPCSHLILEWSQVCSMDFGNWESFLELFVHICKWFFMKAIQNSFGFRYFLKEREKLIVIFFPDIGS